MHDSPIFAAEWGGDVLNELHRLQARHGRHGGWEESLVKHFEELAAAEAERPGRQMLLGQARILAGRFHEAIEVFQTCRSDPDMALQAWNWMGIAAAGMQGFNSEQMAIANFRKGLERAPASADAVPLHYNLALMLERVGKFDQAAKHFHMVGALSPGFQDVEAMETEAWRIHGMCDQRGDQIMRGPLPVPHSVFLEKGRFPPSPRRRE